VNSIPKDGLYLTKHESRLCLEFIAIKKNVPRVYHSINTVVEGARFNSQSGIYWSRVAGVCYTIATFQGQVGEETKTRQILRGVTLRIILANLFTLLFEGL